MHYSRPGISRAKVLIFSIMILLFIAACGASAEPTATPAPAPVATSIPVPAVVPPTATTAPAATTAAPVGAPVATATPAPVPTATAAAAGKRGGVFNQGMSRLTKAYNIDFLTSSRDIVINSQFYAGLLAVDYKAEITLDLASDWQWEDDGMKMRFNLLPDLQFHDGTALTSEDVAWSLDKMMGRAEGHGALARVGLLDKYIDEIETVDPTTVIITLKRPAAIMPLLIAQDFTGITKKGTTTEELSEKPYGAGAFLFSEVVPGSHIVTERNPNYHKPGLPYLDGIRMQAFGDDTAAIAALATGKVDWYRGRDVFSPTMVGIMDGVDGLGIHEVVGSTNFGMIFNLTVDSPFRDKKVRQAISLAVDRQANNQDYARDAQFYI